MIERPRTHDRKAAEETAEVYLSNLGLEWKQLEGKKVLDIGAMDAQFAHAARRRGVEVISIDKDFIEDEWAPPRDSTYAVANATRLPFANGTFDYAIAHTSAMHYIEDRYEYDGGYAIYLEDVLREACRVLKEGGQYRFTPTALEEELRERADEAIPAHKTDAYVQWKIEREYRFLEPMAKRAGFERLELCRFEGEQLERLKYDYNYMLTHFFMALKGEKKAD